jgi:hypothetical protein
MNGPNRTIPAERIDAAARVGDTGAMWIEIVKGTDDDAVHVTRADGSRASTRFPKKGPVPHDGVHAIVERALGMRRAFWGHVANGKHPEDIAALAAAAGPPERQARPRARRRHCRDDPGRAAR